MPPHSPLSGGRASKTVHHFDRASLLEAQDEILALLDSGAKLDVVLARIACEIDAIAAQVIATAQTARHLSKI
jgi:hypothetical protein